MSIFIVFILCYNQEVFIFADGYSINLIEMRIYNIANRKFQNKFDSIKFLL